MKTRQFDIDTVVLALLKFADVSVVEPSLQELADSIDVNISTIRGALERLELRGLVTFTRREHRGVGVR